LTPLFFLPHRNPLPKPSTQLTYDEPKKGEWNRNDSTMKERKKLDTPQRPTDPLVDWQERETTL
jgi:hypothetical protein